MHSPQLESSYQELPNLLFSKTEPSALSNPQPIALNKQLAEQLGIDTDWLTSREGIEVLSGNRTLENSSPIASAYGGHQFGNWNPGLGDGRAVLLGEIQTDNRRFDLQLKGSGRTPYSRGGDGRSPLGPVLREYLISEAMHALDIPTSRSLSAIATDDLVFRETPLRGGILCRVASSHIRVGTFQFASAQGNKELLKNLADYTIARHYPTAKEHPTPYIKFLQLAIEAQAKLIAQWQLVGFIHGVMNTDNMLVCGETIDYGPCAFMDAYMKKTCFSYIDQGGRYDYRNQPGIGQWNLSWLAQALLPLIDDIEEQAIEAANDLLGQYAEYYKKHYEEGLHKKLGLDPQNKEHRSLTEAFMSLMAEHKPDYTLSFRHLTRLANPESPKTLSFELPDAFDTWKERWQIAIANQTARATAMLAINPAIIPRNHQVEIVLEEAYDQNFEPFQRLLKAVQKPFEENRAFIDLMAPPREEQIVANTFCGT